jgi:serine/threonine-protein kinase
VVLSMNPAPGTLQPPGTQITVKVSRGKAPITIPNVVGLDFNTANGQLTALGLTVAQVQKQDAKPAGTVIKQSLSVGAGVTKGTTIVLTVSTGPPLVQVPDLTNQGIGFDDAVARLQQLGLPAIAVANFPGGQVRQMNPAPGTMVAPGTQIQLWVY